jgi:hypothetical protein
VSYKEHKDLVIHCRQIVIRHISDCSAFFKRMDDLLFQNANDAAEEERKAYFFAMRQLRAHETQFTEGLIERVLACFDQYWTDTVAADPPIKLNRREVNDEYSALHYRFSYLLGYAVPVDKQPLSVEMLSTCFKQSLARFVNIDGSIKTLAYQQFNRTVQLYSNQMYHNLNQHLIKQKVLTNLRYKQVEQLDDIVAAHTAKEIINTDRTVKPTTRLKQLQIGNRLIYSDIDPNQTVFFAWHSTLTGRYIFNDQQGESAIDVSQAELLDLFKHGLLTPLAKPTEKIT